MHIRIVLCLALATVLISSPHSPLLSPGFCQPIVTYHGDFIFTCPGGDTPSLLSQGSHIDMQLLDGSGTPVANFPFEDMYWDDIGSGDVCPCDTHPDASTDALGNTTWTTAPYAGGYTVVDSIDIYIIGAPQFQWGHVRVASPDLNCSGDVNLLDLAIFAADWVDWNTSGIYNARSDFTNSLSIGLGDIGLFVLHMKPDHVCP